MSLLTSLASEVDAFTSTGSKSLLDLKKESDDFLSELKRLESQLEQELQDEGDKSVDFTLIEKRSGTWYKQSIASIKTYNSLINKFQKNILNNSKFNINLDDAYTYPLLLSTSTNSPTAQTEFTSDAMLHSPSSPAGGSQELNKAIIIHLLKTCQSTEVAKQLLSELLVDVLKDGILEKFVELKEIVDDILVGHNLTRAIKWLSSESLLSGLKKHLGSRNSELEFKFHILQYVLILNGKNEGESFTEESALRAYQYTKEHFSNFDAYFEDFQTLMLLLCFSNVPSNSTERSEEPQLDDLFKMMKKSINDRERRRKSRITASKMKPNKSFSLFFEKVLVLFKSIHKDQSLYASLVNDLISEYCKDLNLLNDSSLFQSILAGFFNLPNFHKYHKIQQKLKKVDKSSVLEVKSSVIRRYDDVEDYSGDEREYLEAGEISAGTNHSPATASPSFSSSIAPFTFELPFQLPDSSTNLFNFHPIFICPVSKEQLIPLTISEEALIERKRKRSFPSTAVSAVMGPETTIIHTTNGNSTITNNSRIVINRQQPSSHDALLQITVLDRSNQVVVLKYCQHLALRDSILQLSKNGTEVFKCHYCYKKHKITDVTDGYFIDL